MNVFVSEKNDETITLLPITKDVLSGWLDDEGKDHKNWVEANQYKAAAGSVLMVPSDDKSIKILVGIDEEEPHWSWGGIVSKLPAGRYQLPDDMEDDEIEAAMLGWALGQYNFDAYKSKKNEKLIELVVPSSFKGTEIINIAQGIYLTRDLINTPAQDMGPAQLAKEAQKLAKDYKANFSAIVGDDLLSENYPMIHAVGRAAAEGREPRLIKLTWGKKSDPAIALVGKGVCFDTGGLDLKGSQYMLTMKKDMGGAANILGLASMIMSNELNVHLTVLIPAVENAVSGDSYRPMDILTSRDGTTVEIGNTDAEGRLVLADAITEALEGKPELIIDMATLTGAARVALGTDMPAIFCNNDEMVNGILRKSATDSDPLWRMPLHAPYRKMLDNDNADISNISAGGYGGAITAALFLEHFVGTETPWAHIDLMAYNLSAKNGRPKGGEAQGIRALYTYLAEKYK
ncbi:leucyl aminopeptidase family protein [Curvivirga aplysinae]|uniref:leucyl aminopeptidase family protein n=1 Tax=Curvivirga aplysinae TaxID=2529852 RepID=UPI0012BBA71A|nr:leucyl aminopeptidase family protein [Curvivirga aplysinae]MTI10235.1 leucyl aminopeptidase family protein [Curvivirga aplysinae]